MDRRELLRPREWILLVAATGAVLAVVWTLDRYPSQDLPAHLEIASLLGRFLAPGESAPERYFAFNPRPEPNWLVYPLLAALLPWLGAELTAKIALSLYLIAWPAAAIYAVSGIRRRAAFVAFLGLPLMPSYFFSLGFLNFCFGLLLALTSLGFWWRRATGATEPPGVAATLGLATLLLLTVLSHPVAFGLAVMALIGVELGRRRIPSRVFLAATPAATVVSLFLAGAPAGGEEAVWMPFTGLVKHLLVLSPLVSYTDLERLVSIATLLCFTALVVVALRADRPSRDASWDGLLAAGGVLLGLYFVAPLGVAGGGYLNQRLLLGLLVVLLLWLASRPALDDWRTPVTVVGPLLVVLLVALQWSPLRQLDGQLDDMLAVTARIPDGATVATLSYAHRGVGSRNRGVSRKVAPFPNALGWVAAERPIVDLTSYHAGRGYFPVIYREPCDPFGTLWQSDLAAEPPVIVPSAFRRRGCALDYVLVWGRRGRPLPRSLAEYRRAATSENGLAELYQAAPAARRPHG